MIELAAGRVRRELVDPPPGRSAADYRVSVAPMMECTDRHCRYLLRLIAPSVRLYSEMVTAAAVLRGDRERLLGYDPAEQPLALQLGGSEPLELARAAVIAEQRGYAEINLNVGCPSNRVQSGRFGACLMAEPERVADCIAAMRARVAVPVTVKTRIGIDDRDDYDFLAEFVSQVAAAGCRVFFVHARKAVLRGLSPKENRGVPPLDYARVYRLKAENPALTIVLNGGVRTLSAVEGHLRRVDGVMIGREAYHNPYFLAAVQRAVYLRRWRPTSRREIVEAYLAYVAEQLALGRPLAAMARPLLGLFHGERGARRWRRDLSERMHRSDAGIGLIEAALQALAPISREVDEPSLDP